MQAGHGKAELHGHCIVRPPIGRVLQPRQCILMLLRLSPLRQSFPSLRRALFQHVLDQLAAAADLLAALGTLGQEPVGHGPCEAGVGAKGVRREEHVGGVGDGDVLPLRVAAQLRADEDDGRHAAVEDHGIGVPVNTAPF